MSDTPAGTTAVTASRSFSWSGRIGKDDSLGRTACGSGSRKLSRYSGRLHNEPRRALGRMVVPVTMPLVEGNPLRAIADLARRERLVLTDVNGIDRVNLPDRHALGTWPFAISAG